MGGDAGADCGREPRITRGRCRPIRAAVLALALFGCATGPIRIEAGRIQQTVHGYSVMVPSGTDERWERSRVEGATAAYAWRDALMSLQSRCGGPLTRPQILARHLVIGLPERTLRQAGPVSAGGAPGWTQIFDTRLDDRAVRIKTVTLVSGTCAVDWILSARTAFEAAEPDFDAWWQSFRAEAPPAARPPEAEPAPPVAS